MNKNLILIILTFFFANNLKAQYFQTGQDPARIKWRQINNVNFQIIYPEEFEKQAQRISYVLGKVYDYGSKSLAHSPKKVSVVLHTRTVESNGLMAWAPKRMELFTTPHQQIYAQDWLEQLALHEFRHLVQMDKVQSELPGLLKIILGEHAAAITVGAYLPLWFLEGDAVVTETALSKSGRGRMASFSMDYRAQVIEKGKYSYDKSYLGSYKDYVPTYYELGYLMVGKSREKYGTDIWTKSLARVGKQPFSLTPLNSEMKKSTGKSISKYYAEVFDGLKIEWERKLKDRVIDSCSVVSPRRKNYVEYIYPEFYHDSLIFAYRTSIDDIGRFVLINPDKTEKVIYTPGTVFKESVSMRDNLVIWAEQQANIRWTHADCSVIMIYNMENKLIHELKPDNKLFSPVISPDLSSFAAVEIDKANNFFISIFNLETGHLIGRFNTPDNQYFFTPCWDEKGERIYAVCLSPKGKCLSSFDLKTKQISQLTDYTFANLKNPVYSNNRIFFSSDFSGIDNLYLLDSHGKIFRVASVPFGADYPAISPSGKQLLFSNYTSSGYQLSTINIQGIGTVNQENSLQLATDSLAHNIAVQEIGVPDFSNADSVFFTSKKYSKLGHLLNIHSWAPAYIDVNNNEIRPGVSVFSQNKLGTASTSLGYDYNVEDRTGRYKLEFTYSGLFPEFSTNLSIGNEASSYYQIENTVNQNNQIIKRDTVLKRLVWNEFTADLDVRLPLNFSRGKYSRGLYPELKYTFNQMSNATSVPSGFYSGNYHAFDYRIYFYNFLHQSGQNIMPKWGQQFDLIYRHTPLSGNDLGSLYGIQSVIYLPGFFKNAGFKIYDAYQGKSFTQLYSFSNYVRFPRGFQSYQANKLYSFAIDYKFPISYPDFSLGKLAYVKRIKSSLFYDYAWFSAPVMDKNGVIHPNFREADLKSVGIELISDLHLLRFFAPIQIGFRSIYRPDYHDLQYNLLFSVDFNGF